MSNFGDMTSLFNFHVICVFLVKFSYWSKFHVNIITGSRNMAVLLYKGLTRNLKIRNTHVQHLCVSFRYIFLKINYWISPLSVYTNIWLETFLLLKPDYFLYFLNFNPCFETCCKNLWRHKQLLYCQSCTIIWALGRNDKSLYIGNDYSA